MPNLCKFISSNAAGAVYSRISAHITGDWNACGKVMGLAPWAGRSATEAEGWFFSGDGNSGDKLSMQAGKRSNSQDPYMPFMTGKFHMRVRVEKIANFVLLFYILLQTACYCL